MIINRKYPLDGEEVKKWIFNYNHYCHHKMIKSSSALERLSSLDSRAGHAIKLPRQHDMFSGKKMLILAL